MTDIALLWSNAAFGADFALAKSQLATDDGLRTAVIISLFSDGRARDDDVLPSGDDRRGWWGDAFLPPSDRIGSRMWLLEREKMLPATLLRLRDYAREALAWLIEDGIAATVSVLTEQQGLDRANIGVEITRPDRTTTRFDFIWPGTAENLGARLNAI